MIIDLFGRHGAALAMQRGAEGVPASVAHETQIGNPRLVSTRWTDDN
jgi:hypothetical protein